VVVGREKSPDLQTDSDSNMPAETMVKFKGMSREDMIEVVIRMEAMMEEKGKRIADMEDYLDSLLLRVMETAPAILAKDAPGCKTR
jgi:Rab11 family-interacting protein 1/2/5